MAAGSAEQLHALAARAQVGASLHVCALRALPPQRASALGRLAYSSHLVSSLWRLLTRLDAHGGGGALGRLVDGICGAEHARLVFVFHSRRAPTFPPSVSQGRARRRSRSRRC